MPEAIRFGVFEFDLRTRELRKRGIRIHVRDQSLEILAMLVERPGELVDREAIRERLWPNGTVVEFEHSVNTAVNRLRDALGDSAGTPRFIETLPKRGYRLLVRVEPVEIPASGHYRILGEAGRGAMGVVYRAEDLRLGRTVALKFLAEELASSPPALDRLRREAQIAASLNHPGICTLYGIEEHEGRPCLAMEYLEGRPLSRLIESGPLKAEQALDVAMQAAEALTVAHSRGIVHGDIKPGNLFVTDSGQVKLTDFGIATRAGDPETAPGRTPGYMAPEQAEGKKVDERSDIFSFGTVLYEMLTGRRAFKGDTPALTLAAILQTEPPPLPAGIPLELEKVVARCLQKDPALRFQHMADVKAELEELKRVWDSGKLAGIQASGRRPTQRWLWAAAAAALLLAVAAWRLREGTPSGALHAVALTSYAGTEGQPSLSPDGKKVAFTWSGNERDNYDIYVKQIGGVGAPVRLTTDPARDDNAAWSPDDSSIAFRRQQQGNIWAIMLMSSLGGQERKLAETEGVQFPYSQLSWTPDAKWLVFPKRDSPGGPSGIWAINVDTHEQRRLTTSVTQSAVSVLAPVGDVSPSISPDGSALAFARGVANYVYEIYVQRLTRDLRPKGEPARVTGPRYATGQGIAWTANGRDIVYSAGSFAGLWRVAVSGGRAPERLPYASPAARQVVISRSPPRLVYTWWLLNTNVWRLDIRTGERKMLIGSTYYQDHPQYSPDGRKIAFQSNRSGNMEVWTCDADGSNWQQITHFDGPMCGAPSWSPDSRWLALDSRAEGQSEIYVVAADGGKPRRIIKGSADNLVPTWSRDGSWIYFVSARSGRYELWKGAIGGGEPVQFTRSGGYYAIESPDGKYIYYIKYSQKGLYRMPAQGGEEEPVLPAALAGVSASFWVASKGVYLLSDAKTIQFLDAATGKTSIVAGLDRISEHMSVSPDNAYVAYGQVEHNTQDLMLVEGFR